MPLLLRVTTGIVLVLGLGGCVPAYYVEPPTSSAGQICTARCASTQTRCIAWEKQRAELARTSCESSKASVIDRCSSIADASNRHRCQAARGAGEVCMSAALNIRDCQATYAQCVLDCGGSVNDTRSATGIPVY